MPSTRGRTVKRNAVPFVQQLEAKPAELLGCRFYGKHKDMLLRIVHEDRRGWRRCHMRCERCGRIVVVDVRKRDGLREVVSRGTVPGYNFKGIGRRTLAERGAIDNTYLDAVEPALTANAVAS